MRDEIGAAPRADVASSAEVSSLAPSPPGWTHQAWLIRRTHKHKNRRDKPALSQGRLPAPPAPCACAAGLAQAQQGPRSAPAARGCRTRLRSGRSAPRSPLRSRRRGSAHRGRLRSRPQPPARLRGACGALPRAASPSSLRAAPGWRREAAAPRGEYGPGPAGGLGRRGRPPSFRGRRGKVSPALVASGWKRLQPTPSWVPAWK